MEILVLIVGIAGLAYLFGKYNKGEEQKREKYFELRANGVLFQDASAKAGYYTPSPVEEPSRYPGEPYVVRHYSKAQRDEWAKLPHSQRELRTAQAETTR